MNLKSTLLVAAVPVFLAIAIRWGASAAAETKTPAPRKAAATQPVPARQEPVAQADAKKHPGGPKFDEMNERANAAENAERVKQTQEQEKATLAGKQAEAERVKSAKALDGRLDKLRGEAKELKPKLALKKPKQRAAKRGTTQTIRRKATGGQEEFELVLHSSGWVDPRLVEYLAGNLQISPYSPTKGRKDESKAWHDNNAVDERADEIAVELTAITPGVDVKRFAWSWPSGFELARAGVLQVRPELIEGISKTQKTLSLPPNTQLKANPIKGLPTPIGKLKPGPAAPGTFSALEMRVTCKSNDNGTPMTPKPLPRVAVRVGTASGTTNATGVLTLNGTFSNVPQTVELTYDTQVDSFGQHSGLRIMAEVHSDSRRESKTVTPQSASGGKVVLGDVELSSVDCETWRLGELALSRYHELVQKSPPAGKLEIKRWSVDWGGTPYTFYNHIVLTEKWIEKDNYVQESWRRSTIHHEFGHSLRHVADGDIHHWNWDNFRWIYARSHSGCEVYNTQYAFNEGWAGYWEDTAMAQTPGGCSGGPSDPVHAPDAKTSAQRAKFVDWVENMVTGHLYSLAQALKTSQCTGADSNACAARKMVEVLERNPGDVHSLWDFEQRYCALHFASNTACRSEGVPTRAQPAACPPGYTDDGATCRLHEVIARPSHTRDVGTLPTNCGSKRYEDGLCYAACPAGYDGAGPLCWERCPSGYRNDGAFCGKPDPYGRGGGYPWQFGDDLNLNNAYKRCEADQGASKCEEWGAIVYPKCRTGFHNVACCICSPTCPNGMPDIGVSCAKRTHDRGIGEIPTACTGGMQYDAGLCYPQCRAGFTGSGPVCWGTCPAGFTEQGALCSRPSVAAIMVKY